MLSLDLRYADVDDDLSSAVGCYHWPFSQRTVTQAWNFRHTQKRRYRGALDALKMAVEAWRESMQHEQHARESSHGWPSFAQLTGLEEGTTLAVHC